MNIWGTFAVLIIGTLNRPTLSIEKNEIINFYLVAIPESRIASFQRRSARQEEAAGGAAEAAGVVGTAGTFVAQILNGILSGDASGVFTGSTSFIPEGDVRNGVQSILLQGLVPAWNRFFREVQTGIQREINKTQASTMSSVQQQVDSNQGQFQQQNFIPQDQTQNQQQFPPQTFIPQDQNQQQFQQPNVITPAPLVVSKNDNSRGDPLLPNYNNQLPDLSYIIQAPPISISQDKDEVTPISKDKNEISPISKDKNEVPSTSQDKNEVVATLADDEIEDLFKKIKL